MLSHTLLKSARIPLLRPLRPPNKRLPQPRLFTQNSQLLLLARHPPRPQLPYLSQPAFRSRAGRGLTARFISTETRTYWINLTYEAGKWTLFLWLITALGSVAYQGVQIELEERENATPGEWRFITRSTLRQARKEKRAIEDGKAPFVDWPLVGSFYIDALQRLEDSTQDGKDLVPAAGAEEGEILIPEVGKGGYDVSGKSYEWRTGYFEVVMGCAEAAEHLDTMVLDTTRRMVFPGACVVGPSNPDPRPVPNGRTPPREEDCERFFKKPETFYMRVLTGKGFTTRQRLDAAEGYANWLEFKGLHESAEEMYRWGIDIASSALPSSVPASAVMDPATYTLKPEASTSGTNNLLRATTSLATHHARTGNTSSALPIFLSVLRARRSAPLAPFITDDEATGPPGPSTDIGVAVATISSLFSSAKFPDPLPSGDGPLTRKSERPTCEEGELMLYIGEILFTQSPRSDEGVGWTRQAVTIAEANLQRQGLEKKVGTEAEKESKKCKECLLTGVGNWEAMLSKLSSQQEGGIAREGGQGGWRGWLGSRSEAAGGEPGPEMLEEELRQVSRLRERIVREGIDEEIMKGRPQSGMWFG